MDTSSTMPPEMLRAEGPGYEHLSHRLFTSADDDRQRAVGLCQRRRDGAHDGCMNAHTSEPFRAASVHTSQTTAGCTHDGDGFATTLERVAST